MIFRSNLITPDLSPHFKLLVKPRGYSFGHDVPSDPDFEPECGSWTHDEAAILYTIAKSVGSAWLDIGCRFGWTSAHIVAGACYVTALDPMLKDAARRERFAENMSHANPEHLSVTRCSSEAYLALHGSNIYNGFVIDGCHDAPEPLNDAMGCAKLAKQTAVIMLHDFWGQPVRDAVTWLMDHEPGCDSQTLGKTTTAACDCGRGYKARVYWTPNGVACCWKGDFEPPVHHGDARIFLAMSGGRFPDFNFARLL